MKTLQKLADQINGYVIKLRFHSMGKCQRGYAIIDTENNEVLTVEPVHYSNGDRWLTKNHCTKDMTYCKNIRQAGHQQVTKGWTGHKFSGLIPGTLMRKSTHFSGAQK